VNRDTMDPRLHALLDGELGAAESAALLAELEHDPALREQLGTLTLGRALLRQAYAGVQPPAAARPPPRPRRAMVLTGLAALAVGMIAGGMVWRQPNRLAETVAAAGPAPAGHVVLHVSAVGEGQALAVLEQAEGLFIAARDSGRPITVEIVANGSGLDLLRRAASTQAERIASMQRAHPSLRFIACGQTVQKLQERGDDVRLLPGTVVASSALDQIVQRLQQGWAYVRL
jgi:intracellular sulfur oxidation DsrE/DsrF family protein